MVKRWICALLLVAFVGTAHAMVGCGDEEPAGESALSAYVMGEAACLPSAGEDAALVLDEMPGSQPPCAEPSRQGRPCQSGGSGSNNCSYKCGFPLHEECGVTCREGFYACCGCDDWSKPYCNCRYENPILVPKRVVPVQ